VKGKINATDNMVQRQEMNTLHSAFHTCNVANIKASKVDNAGGYFCFETPEQSLASLKRLKTLQ
jgi:predicted ATPase